MQKQVDKILHIKVGTYTLNKTDILYIISFRQGELIIPFLRKVHIILGNPGSVGAGHRGEIFKRKT